MLGKMDAIGVSADVFPLKALFDCLSDTVFFVKDANGYYLSANQTLADRCNRAGPEEIIGKSPSELFGSQLGSRYEKQDAQIITAGDFITDQLELHIYPTGQIGWCITNKFPIVDKSGLVIGVTGLSKDLGAPQADDDEFEHLRGVIGYVQNNLSDAPTLAQLSTKAKMSPYQLDARMRRAFGLSTGQWVLRQRLELARQMLASSNLPIAEVALNAGYEDQSAFTRQFRKTTGLTPSQFRQVSGLR